ncbi:MAG TPA: hypothetical protein VHL50_05170 [Pyrinomonadaceae bacterium]|jgi:hypothetical protein|nr:hypothetical protein [Pyrinomonadaceae bacterium]
MAAFVKAKQRHEYDFYFFRVDALVVRRFADMPAIVDELGFFAIRECLEFVGVVVDARNQRRNVRVLSPNTLKDRPRVDLVELWCGDEAVKLLGICQIELAEKNGLDLRAERVHLGLREFPPLREINFAEFGFRHSGAVFGMVDLVSLS